MTSTRLSIPTLLAVACSEDMVRRCRASAVTTGLVVVECALMDVAEVASLRQPLAMVVPLEVYALDPDEFEAIARDVRATLMEIDPEVSVRELEAMCAGAVQLALKQRERRESAGRYALIGGVEAEVPFRLPEISPAPRPRKPAPKARSHRSHLETEPPRSGVRKQGSDAFDERFGERRERGRDALDELFDELFEEMGLPYIDEPITLKRSASG